MSGDEDLKKRLANREDSLIERKLEHVTFEKIAETLIGFANTVPTGTTAVLFIGIADDGRVVGVQNADALQKTVRRACEQKCYPHIEPSIRALPVKLEDRSVDVVAVEVEASTRGPHFFGPSYVRVGSETVKVRDDQYDELFARRCNKARQLLEWRNTVVTVMAHGKKLGTTKRTGSSYREHHECRIAEVTPHFVRFDLLGKDQRRTEPMKNLTLSWDEENHRPLVLVQTPSTAG